MEYDGKGSQLLVSRLVKFLVLSPNAEIFTFSSGKDVSRNVNNENVSFF